MGLIRRMAARPSGLRLQYLPGEIMAVVRQLIVGVFATLLAGINTVALAQPSRAAWASAGLRVEAFDVEEVPQLSSGTPLNFSLYGTPGAAATLQIDGALGSLGLREAQP